MASEQAMRAARAFCEKLYGNAWGQSLYPIADHYAELLDRETGLPGLLSRLAWNDIVNARLEALLAAVEALHSTEVFVTRCCEMCGCPAPCPTLRAARGEHE